MEPQAGFDPRAVGLLYDREAGVWHPTVTRNCLYPTVEVENGHICPLLPDWSAGTLIIGDKDTGKSSVMLRAYLNAIQDLRGAVVLIDPKRSLALRALALTPWLCAKRVWYLNLSRPAFGMSPLRMAASKQAITGVIVDALRDVFSDQIFQASREVIEKSTLAALALAEQEGRPARIEDVHQLMVWENDRLRARAVEACARIPNGDRVRDYFTIELAGDMRENTAHTRDRLRAPRNKLDGLLTSPPLRIYFNHPTEKPLEQIIADRDVLIVDADLGDGGSENSKLMISFLLHMLDSVLTRQQGRPPEEISRVHLFIDEAGHVLNQHLVRMQDTHRESGLTLCAAMHYLDQLEMSVLAGALNMLQNRYLFRIARRRDAAELCDAVSSTVYNSLRDSDRAHVWPEALQSLPNLRCIGSWINHGKPSAPFLGRPYPMPPVSQTGWREHWLAWLGEQVGEYPEHILWRLRDEQHDDPAHADAGDGDHGDSQRREQQEPAAAGSAGSAHQPSGRAAGSQVTRLEDAGTLARAALLDVSRTRLAVCAHSSPGIAPDTINVSAPAAVMELAVLEQIKYRTREPLEDEANEPLPRLNDRDLSALAALDRLGFLTAEQLGRSSYPGRTLDSTQRSLKKLARAGLVHRYPVQLEGQRGGRSTHLYALSPKGLSVAQHPPKGRRPSIDERRQYRASEAVEGRELRHDLQAASWLISFLHAFGTVAADNWRTPRYQTGHLDVPTRGGRRGERQPISSLDAERHLPEHYCFVELDEPHKLAPDLSIELRIPEGQDTIVTDLLVEINNRNPEYNAGKLRRYDSLLCGWSLTASRYQKLGARPFGLFVCRDLDALRALARVADEALTGAVGIKGTADPSKWYYAGRDHLAFTTIELIHYGLPTAWMLPPHPPAVRQQLGTPDGYKLAPVSLLSPALVARGTMVGWELRGGRAVPVTSEDSR